MKHKLAYGQWRRKRWLWFAALFLFNRQKEKKTIEKHLATFVNQVSNLEKSLDVVVGYACKLNTMWDSGDYIQKQQLQKLIFLDAFISAKKGNM